ncbi:phage tail protein [Vibrio sp. TRT 17S01]|uniref:phage tail-collar fiber domain-containing protein n=1 Tax=Vibrio sp. TRT 17S01 TaxID=3418505 RepID=UPI003CE6C5CE
MTQLTPQQLNELDTQGYITLTGIAAEAAAKAQKTKVDITHMKIDGGLLPNDQSPVNVNAMVSDYGADGLFPCSVKEDANNPGEFIVQIDIPADHHINGQGYQIWGLAAITDKGEIYAYRRVEGDFKSYKPGEAKSFIYRLRFQTSNADVISYTIDPSVVLATDRDLNEAIEVHKNEPKPHSQYAELSILIGVPLPYSIVGAHLDMAFLCDGSDYAVADYPKIWKKIQNAANLVPQDQIDAKPEENACNYGISADGLRFTVPNYTLMPHIAVAGPFGAAGSTVVDQMQKIDGIFSSVTNSAIFERDNFFLNGAFYGKAGVEGYRKLDSLSNIGTGTYYRSVGFDSSLVARTGEHTEVNSSFLNFYIIHGESA